MIPLPPVAASTYPHSHPKNRVLSFVVNEPDLPQAMQVELAAVGPPACYTDDPTGDVGRTWWITRPVCTDLNGDPVAAPPCDEPNVWRAQLTVAPVCHGGANDGLPCDQHADCGNARCGQSIWPQDCIHIADCEVIPVATYAVRTAWYALGPSPLFSEPLEIGTIAHPGTKCWADLVGQWEDSPGHWTAPNRVVNMDDVMSAVMYFKTHPHRPHRTWVEVNDRKPDMVLNFGDIQQIVDGFMGNPYPFENPSACPVGVQ